MGYTDDIFKRSNLQQIREFLLYGTEAVTIESGSLEERLKQKQTSTFALLHQKFPDPNEYDEVLGVINGLLSVFEEVYMEIGMQVGASITHQLLQSPNQE